jgi:NADH dehydrogenase
MVKRIVILGAGFAGMSVAQHLERNRKLEVYIVDRNNYMLFTPMLPEISSGAVESRHIARPLRSALRRSTIILGDVIGVDFDHRTVMLGDVLEGAATALQFDALVVALGAASSTHGIPGAQEHSFPLQTIEDGVRLRNHAIRMLETATSSADPAVRKKTLTFVIVGGGFTGVEAAGELRGYLTSLCRFYPSIRPDDIRVVLVCSGDRLLEQLPERFGLRAAAMLETRGIEIVLGNDAVSVDAAGVTLASGKRYESGGVVWSAGVRPAPIIEHLALKQSKHHAVIVNPDFSVPDRSDVWSIGDCAQIPKPGGGFFAQTAQDAIVEAPLLAHNIIASMNGHATRAFRYRSPGMMAALGHREGIAELWFGIMLTGFPAWLLWRMYYLLRLPGAASKVRVALDWSLALFFRDDITSISRDKT